jgi:hypothetical protein
MFLPLLLWRLCSLLVGFCLQLQIGFCRSIKSCRISLGLYCWLYLQRKAEAACVWCWITFRNIRDIVWHLSRNRVAAAARSGWVGSVVSLGCFATSAGTYWGFIDGTGLGKRGVGSRPIWPISCTPRTFSAWNPCTQAPYWKGEWQARGKNPSCFGWAWCTAYWMA